MSFERPIMEKSVIILLSLSMHYIFKFIFIPALNIERGRHKQTSLVERKHLYSFKGGGE